MYETRPLRLPNQLRIPNQLERYMESYGQTILAIVGATGYPVPNVHQTHHLHTAA